MCVRACLRACMRVGKGVGVGGDTRVLQYYKR